MKCAMKFSCSYVVELIPFDVAEHLGVTEKFAEVDMKHVPRLTNHDVVVMPIANAKHVSRHTITGTRTRE